MNTNDLITAVSSLIEDSNRKIVVHLAQKYGFSSEEAFAELNMKAPVPTAPVPTAPAVPVPTAPTAPVPQKKIGKKPLKIAIKPQVSEPVVLKKNKRNDKFHGKEVAITPLQVTKMSDEELLDTFSEVTGLTHLSCKHCHSETVKVDLFTKVIRKWCLKKANGGIFKEMSVPKTCDHQSFANLKRQPYYTKIRNAPSGEIAAVIKAENIHLFGDRRNKSTREN